jgi:hypothetical protein
VGADGKLLPQRIIAKHGAPNLSPRKEEALIASEPVNDGSISALERIAIRFVCDGEATKITDILSHGDAAVDTLPGKVRELNASY